MKAFIRIILMACIVSSCNDFLDVDPPKTSLSTVTVFTNEETATAALVRLYVDMAQYSNTFAAGETSLTNLGALLSDEFINYSPFNDLEQFSQNKLNTNNMSVLQNWTTLYNFIYSCNGILEGLEESDLPATAKRQLGGEAKFMRAFYYFYLVNYWGDVPLATSTDYTINSALARTSTENVYEQIESDLIEAQGMLPVNNSSEKIRPDKQAATALLARVYLYLHKWSEADSESSKLLNDNTYTLESDLNNVFLKENTETIWQLQSIVPYVNTWEGYTFVLRSIPDISSVRPELVNGFEADDLRFTNWMNQYADGIDTWYYPFKYKVRLLPDAASPKTEYLIILRLAEQFLIRAEARAQLNNLPAALADLNTVRTRAGLSTLTPSDKSSTLLAIEQERRVEFFAEWGHRWLDLKRTQRALNVLSPVKTGIDGNDLLFPIPQQERNRNSLLDQNPGY